MLKNYLKITFRSIWKNKLFAFINVFGLGIALACCIVAYLNWDYNVKFDAYHENSDRIYRVNFIRITNGNPIKNGSCPMPLGQAIRESIGQVDKVMRYSPVSGDFKRGDDLFSASVGAVDPEFIEEFTVELIYGDKKLMQGRRCHGRGAQGRSDGSWPP